MRKYFKAIYYYSWINPLFYHDVKMKKHPERAVVFKTSKWWRIVKKQGSHKIDLIIGMAIACQGETKLNTSHREWIII